MSEFGKKLLESMEQAVEIAQGDMPKSDCIPCADGNRASESLTPPRALICVLSKRRLIPCVPRWQAEKGFEILLSRQATVPNKKQVTFFERNLLILWSGKRDLNPLNHWNAD